MKHSVQARLDAKSQTALTRLVDKGWSTSAVVREGIRLVAACHAGARAPKIIGLGQFSSTSGDVPMDASELKGLSVEAGSGR